MDKLPKNLQDFIANETWIFAKTYAKTWPHEYIVQEQVDNILFNEFAQYVDSFGHKEKFYNKSMIYLNFENYTYWHMENIINRCLHEDTYERRERDGRLPKDI